VRSRAWTVLLLLAGLALLGGAAYHVYHHVSGLPPPLTNRTAARDPNTVRPWMTLRYVSRAYAVPEPVLLRALGVGPQQARHHTLAGIAALKGVGTQTVLDEVRAAIRQYREAAQERATPAARPAP